MRSMYLVRHGSYDNPMKILPGRLPIELSQAGKDQIEQLAGFFSQRNIATIYSSAVLRCKQTSEILSKNKIPIRYDHRLLETLSAYQGYWHANFDLFFKYQSDLGGESYQDIQRRMKSFFSDVVKEEQGNFIICSHGDPLYVLLLHLLGLPLSSTLQEEKNMALYPKKGRVIEVTIDTGKVKAVQFL